MKISSSNKLRTLHLFNHISLIWGLTHYSPLWLLLSCFCWFLYGCLGISIGFHRLLAHRSFKTNSFWFYTTTILGCLATGGSPIAWASAHRLHHRYADTAEDPHSSKHLGFFRVYLHLWRPFAVPISVTRDLVKSPFLLFCHRHYFKIITLTIIAFYLIDPRMGIFAYSVPGVIAFHAFAWTNTLGHSHGYRTYALKDSSTNSWLSNLLTWGEGWHNNHHRFPSSYRVGLLPRQWDPGAWCIEHLPYMANESLLQKQRSRVMKSPSQVTAQRP